MTQEDIETMLIRIVRNIQELSGREQVHVTPETRPVLDMPGFDSLNGVEVTVDVLDELKIDVGFNNVLVDEAKALTVAQAAARLLDCMPRN